MADQKGRFTGLVEFSDQYRKIGGSETSTVAICKPSRGFSALA